VTIITATVMVTWRMGTAATATPISIKDGCDKHDDDKVEHDDEEHGHHFSSTSVDSADYNTAADGRTMTLTGTGLDNGLPVGFTLIAIDHDDAIPATYSIILTNGYAFVGNFVAGTVSIE
jgi:hypothetical protein